MELTAGRAQWWRGLGGRGAVTATAGHGSVLTELPLLQGQEEFINVVSTELGGSERREHSRGRQAHGESWEMLSGR